jgi:hypothetical protein
VWEHAGEHLSPGQGRATRRAARIRGSIRCWLVSAAGWLLWPLERVEASRWCYSSTRVARPNDSGGSLTAPNARSKFSASLAYDCCIIRPVKMRSFRNRCSAHLVPTLGLGEMIWGDVGSEKPLISGPAGVWDGVSLGYAQDLGSGAARRGGSSPPLARLRATPLYRELTR